MNVPDASSRQLLEERVIHVGKFDQRQIGRNAESALGNPQQRIGKQKQKCADACGQHVCEKHLEGFSEKGGRRRKDHQVPEENHAGADEELPPVADVPHAEHAESGRQEGCEGKL